MSTEIWFTSLGMVVLDELIFSSRTVADVVGGSGVYATFGARLFRPYPFSSSIGWALRLGEDFPPQIKTELKSWGCTLFLREEKSMLSTRGRLSYKDGLGTKTFEYLTPLIEILPVHLEPTPLLSSRAFHLLASPEELTRHVSSLMKLRLKASIEHPPSILWEPRPASCTPANFEAIFRAVKLVDVFSPNHTEIAQIYGSPVPEKVNREVIERYALDFIDAGIGKSNHGSLVLRAGEAGCMVGSRSQKLEWIEPFYLTCGDRGRHEVVDPTGAGNAFLGAFAVGFLETGNLTLAASYGNVGASFALEQVGLPHIERCANGRELWNGVEAGERLREYQARLRWPRSSTD